MKVGIFWHCGVVCLDHLGRPQVRIDPVTSRFEASVNQAKQLTLAGWCHSWSRVINLLREGTSKESRDPWQTGSSKQKTFFPWKSLMHFVLVESVRRKHLEAWKFLLSLPSPVSFFSPGSTFFFSIYHLEAENRIHCKQDLFSVTYLSAHEVWEIRVDIYWRKEEMGVTLLILLFS